MAELITYTAKEVRLNTETGQVPAFDRSTKATDPIVPLTEKKVCQTPKEVLGSKAFQTVVERYLKNTENTSLSANEIVQSLFDVVDGDKFPS